MGFEPANSSSNLGPAVTEDDVERGFRSIVKYVARDLANKSITRWQASEILHKALKEGHYD